MTDDGTIRPALSAEQWPYLKEVVAHHRSGKLGWGIMAEAEDDGTLTLDVRAPQSASTWTVEDRHALAALSLYGQPFGFTPDDVELLRRCADACDGTDNAKDDDRVFPDGIVMRMKDVRRLQSIASRIASLLPPETTP